MTLIMGIDPGSQNTGFGIIKVDGNRIEHISHGVISVPPSLEFNERIGIIAAEVEILMERIQPQITVIERIFLGKNADSAFKLGHARGVIVASAIRSGAEVIEYATRVVKRGITGNGNADKDQVQAVLFASLGIRERAKADASDALALAYYHARQIEIDRTLKNQTRRSRGLKESGL